MKPEINKNLTTNQEKILRMMIQGLERKEAATKLGIHPHSVWWNLKTAQTKLGAKSTIQACVIYDRLWRKAHA